jgi:U4/U6.U5 tri-snRNP-associated protein 2
LTLDIPKTPLYKDTVEKIQIPQISIYQLFKKYDGVTFTDDQIKGVKRRYSLTMLPKNLILYFKRFEKNLFFIEKNPTIINFPIKKVSLEEMCTEDTVGRENNYNLLANILHDGKYDSGTFKVQVKSKALDKWFEIQDLYVTNILAQSVIVSESYIHVYEASSSSDTLDSEN